MPKVWDSRRGIWLDMPWDRERRFKAGEKVMWGDIPAIVIESHLEGGLLPVEAVLIGFVATEKYVAEIVSDRLQNQLKGESLLDAGNYEEVVVGAELLRHVEETDSGTGS